jgi:dTDP-4-dehydrorhamnose reductase
VIGLAGGKGMLGGDVAALFRAGGIDFKVYDLPEFDLAAPGTAEEMARECSAIVNCSAFSDVERSESEPEKAFAVNAEAVGRLGSAAARRGLWILHFGTDFVFDGTLGRPYREDDAPNPLNAYGRSKLEGERLLAASGCRRCLLRIQWTYGRSGQNFVRKIVAAARSRPELRVVDDQVGSPTATSEVARLVFHLLELKAEGTYHFCAAGSASRFEAASFIVDALGLRTRILPCKSGDFKTAARRPLNSRFDCSKIRALTGEGIEDWRGPLGRFLKSP